MQVPARHSFFRRVCHASAAVFFPTSLPLAAQSPQLLPEMVVLAERRGDDDTARTLAVWDCDELREAAPRTIDELMAREPAFSLYRRQTAIFGNPTTAGVSLRNTGATAASRTLVLLDGVPQNDPFGGWVYWARYDAAALDSIRIVPSSRAAVWGNQSPAGVVSMTGLPPFVNNHVIKAGGGGQGTVAGSTLHQMTSADESRSFSLAAFGLHSDGFYAVDSPQRGPIDRKLDIDLYGADVKLAWLAAPGLTIGQTTSFYTEERGNGTPLSRNSTDALDFSLSVTSENADHTWQALAWHQRREFESVFSSVNADRSAETLANPLFPRLRSGQPLFQRPSPQKQIPSNKPLGMSHDANAAVQPHPESITAPRQRPEETAGGPQRLSLWRLAFHIAGANLDSDTHEEMPLLRRGDPGRGHQVQTLHGVSRWIKTPHTARSAG